jgi:hypothetical protein
MISQATLLANDGLDLIIEPQKQQTPAYGIDSIEPKCQELEEMKTKLTEQIHEKRQNLKLLRTYIDKLESVKNCFDFNLLLKISIFRLMIGVHVVKIC